MFGHLYLYEIVLLILGIILFLILSVALAMHVIRKEPFGKLFYFFFIPILMIGYTSIREFQVGELHITMDRQIEEVLSNPNDPEARKQLEEYVNALKERANTPEEKLKLGKAYLLLQKPDDAIKLANEVEKETASEPTGEEGMVNSNPAMDQINDIKRIAEIQKNISGSEEDSSQIKSRFDKANISNPQLKNYFSNKYIRR